MMLHGQVIGAAVLESQESIDALLVLKDVKDRFFHSGRWTSKANQMMHMNSFKTVRSRLGVLSLEDQMKDIINNLNDLLCFTSERDPTSPRGVKNHKSGVRHQGAVIYAGTECM